MDNDAKIVPGRYRKRPVVIEAEQWFPGRKVAGVTICGSGRVIVRTLEGVLEVSPGDVIITGVEGEKYPCKPGIFVKTYERDLRGS